MSIRSRRTKPRHGRMTPQDLGDLRVCCWIRSGGVCEREECGKIMDSRQPPIADNSYHMAHIKAKRIGGDSLENVRALCGECHRKEHNYGPSMTKPVPCKAGEQ